jgi:hypothetical protein
VSDLLYTAAIEEGEARLAAIIRRKVIVRFGNSWRREVDQIPLACWLEPSYFAHFHGPSSDDPNELLRELYVHIGSDEGLHELRANALGLMEIPNVGTFVNLEHDKTYSLSGPKHSPDLVDCAKGHRMRLVPVTRVGNTPMRLRTFPHPYFATMYDEFAIQAERCGTHFAADLDLNSSTFVAPIQAALVLIESVAPALYGQVVRLIRDLVILRGEGLIGGTSLSMHGVVFLVPWLSSPAFFADHLIHESAHIALNVMLYDLERYFRRDPFETVFTSPFRPDARGLYHALHATFVLARLTAFYDRALSRGSSAAASDETVGRLAFCHRGLLSGLQQIECSNYYTEVGRHLVADLRRVSNDVASRWRHLLPRVRLDGQNVEFDPALHRLLHSPVRHESHEIGDR